MTDYANLRKIVTGDIIIKCRLNKDIRRIPINQVPNYDELCLMMYRVFKSGISKPENIILKYMDNEGDMISLLDDIDISHAISISSLLKITVYDKVSVVQPLSSAHDSLIEIRDSLNELIQFFKEEESTKKTEKGEDSKATRQLTPSQLEFLDVTKLVDNKETEDSKLSTLYEPALGTPSSQIPYYPPPPSQLHVKQTQPQQQPVNYQYIQTQSPVGASQQKGPISLQAHPQTSSQTNPQSSSYPSQQQQQQFSAPAYPPAPHQVNTINHDPRLQHQNQHQQHQQQHQNQQQQHQQQQQNQQQQNQPARQGYYVPPPPTSMSATPHLPPQPYNTLARW